MNARLKRTVLSLKQKYEILQKIKENMKVKDICKLFKIEKTMIIRIKKSEEKLEKFMSDGFQRASKVKRIKKYNFQKYLCGLLTRD